VIAEHLRGEICARGISREKVSVVPNGVDLERFRPRPPDPRIKSELGLGDEPCIGYVGTLYPWEGVEDLIRAAPLMRARQPNLRVLIVGSGLQEDRVRSLISQIDVADYVTFVGSIPHEDIQRYYSVLDLLVYPRRSTRNTELATPLKPLEPMAMGKAIVGSDVGGIRELLPPEQCITFRAGAPEDLSEKCVQLLVDPQRRQALANHCRRHVVTTRNWQVITQLYEQVYSRALLGSTSVVRNWPSQSPYATFRTQLSQDEG